ncbi:MAG: diguanylate cyclase [Steroidobacteraceae bacterium]|nr:diguanylate cyclase [Steroidobacteraceae bacterium]MCC7198276.1 diguanylate cyclase [Gammaproteobacteria bacterium]
MNNATQQDRRLGGDPVQPAARRQLADELATVMTRMLWADWLVLAVATFELVAHARAKGQWSWWLLLAPVLFAMFTTWLRLPWFPLAELRQRIATGVFVTIVFVGSTAGPTGGAHSPLVTLFLVPLVLAAMTLRTRLVVLTLGLVAAACVMLNRAQWPAEPDWADFAADVLGQVAPFALATWLVHSLAGTALFASQRLVEVTEYDELTGLRSARAFDEALRQHHAKAEFTSGSYALLHIDFEQLRSVNDAHGRTAGDAALCALASAIQRSVRNVDVAARYGGDEFAVLLPDAGPDVGDAIAQRIRNSFYASLVEANGRALRNTAGVGIACFPRDARKPDVLMSLAEKRMRDDKGLRRRST